MNEYDQKIANLNKQIEQLKKQIEIEEHRYTRRKNSLKKEIAKGRSHRMIFCTGRIEYHLKNALNIEEHEFNNLTDDEVRGIVDAAFSDMRVCTAVRQIFSRRRAEGASPGDTAQ